MNLKRILTTSALGLAACVAVSFLYASTNEITETNTAAELDKLLKENKLVVVEFYNPTCPVCNAFKNKGIFPKTAAALPHIKFDLVSSQEGQALHHEFRIEAFPTFIFFRNGKEVTRYKGYVEAPQFIKKVSGIFSAAELKDSDSNTPHP